MKFHLFIAMLIFLVACTQTGEIKELALPRHNTIYVFSYDVRESLRVPMESRAEIIETFSQNNKVTIVFNGSSEKDNAYFAVTSFNIVSKLDQYFYNEGAPLSFDVIYNVNGTWYNKTKDPQTTPVITGAVIWLKGPNTGAERTAVYMSNGYIFVEGTDSKNLGLAGDRLSLFLMGINSFEDIENPRT